MDYIVIDEDNHVVATLINVVEGRVEVEHFFNKVVGGFIPPHKERTVVLYRELLENSYIFKVHIVEEEGVPLRVCQFTVEPVVVYNALGSSDQGGSSRAEGVIRTIQNDWADNWDSIVDFFGQELADKLDNALKKD